MHKFVLGLANYLSNPFRRRQHIRARIQAERQTLYRLQVSLAVLEANRPAGRTALLADRSYGHLYRARIA